MIKFFSKVAPMVVILFLLSACVTTRETSTINIGGRTSNISSDGFDKKKAAVNRVNSGLTYLNHNNFERAKFHLDRAFKYDPDSGNVNYALGIYYQRVNDLKRSQQHFIESLDVEPENPQFLNAYAAFLCEKGEYKKAEKTFQKAISIPTYTDVSYAYFNVGFCALKQSQLDKAEKYFRKSLSRNKRMAGALIEMAKIEYDKKRYNRAMSYLNRYENNSRSSSESAWLGLRIAYYVRDKDAIAQYGLILQQRFPDSDETASFLDDKQQWM